jgi:hypothetical protein
VGDPGAQRSGGSEMDRRRTTDATGQSVEDKDACERHKQDWGQDNQSIIIIIYFF